MGERGDHEGAVGRQLWPCTVCAEEGDGGIPGSDGVVCRIRNIGVEGDGVVGESGKDDEIGVVLPLDNPLFDGIELVLVNRTGRRRGEEMMWTRGVRWEEEDGRHVTLEL